VVELTSYHENVLPFITNNIPTTRWRRPFMAGFRGAIDADDQLTTLKLPGIARRENLLYGDDAARRF